MCARLHIVLGEDPQAVDLFHAIIIRRLQDNVAVRDFHILRAHQFYYEVVEALAVQDDDAVAGIVCSGQLAHEERAFGSDLFPSLRVGREGVDDSERCDLHDPLHIWAVAAQDQEVQLGVCARGRRRDVGGGVVCECCCVGLVVVGHYLLRLPLGGTRCALLRRHADCVCA